MDVMDGWKDGLRNGCDVCGGWVDVMGGCGGFDGWM